MKNSHYERLATRMREYHRAHPWNLQKGGLYIPYSYHEMNSDSLTQWDEVGFILNGRRVIVWFRHPRYIYANEVQDQVWKEVGPGPNDNWLFDGATKSYDMVGKSGKRKKLRGYICRSPSSATEAHYQKRREIEEQLTKEGIACTVQPNWKLERLNWAIGVTLIAPLEVRNNHDAAKLAHLARALILRQKDLKEEFSGYSYGRADWVREQEILESKKNKDTQ